MRLGICTAHCTVDFVRALFFSFLFSLPFSLRKSPPIYISISCLSIPDDFYPLMGYSMIPAAVPSLSLVLEHLYRYQRSEDTRSLGLGTVLVPSGLPFPCLAVQSMQRTIIFMLLPARASFRSSEPWGHFPFPSFPPLPLYPPQIVFP